MSEYKYLITENLSNLRLDKALSNLCDEFSRSQIQKAIKNGNITINGKIIDNLSSKVKENDEITLIISEEKLENIGPTNIPLDIIYEDEDLLVINKTVNMTVHPGAGNYSDTLVNALLYHTQDLSDVGGEFRPGIVHRLDKDTSGLMVVAKNNQSHENLSGQISTRELVRKYKALTFGIIKPMEGVIDIPIDRSTSDRKKMTTVKFGGRNAITHYKTLEIFCGGLFSLVECKLETGRTHQLRVHLSHSGHSVVGDQTYGNNKRKIQALSENIGNDLEKIDHQLLHSFYISFIHPKTNERLEFFQDLPEDYQNFLNLLRAKSS